jgi:hypothetical protein
MDLLTHLFTHGQVDVVARMADARPAFAGMSSAPEDQEESS